MERYQFTLTNSPAELERVQNELQTVLQTTGLRLHVISAVNVAIGEWMENIFQYAYDDGASHQIGIECSVGPGDVEVQVIDDGREFNPCDYPALDAKATRDNAYAGRGIHLIRRLMDDVRHERRDGRNILSLSKRIS